MDWLMSVMTFFFERMLSVEFTRFLVDLVIVIGIFALSVVILKRIFSKLASNDHLMSHKLLNPREYLPEEKIFSQKQIYYLAMIVIFVVNLLYAFINWGTESHSIIILDIAVSLFVAIQLDLSTRKNKVLFLLLVPYSALSYLALPYSYVVYLDIFHGFVYFYLIKVYIEKFLDYTKTNSLGITIILLFAIVFISFLITMPAEDVSPINALEMVSNAFTSNGYTVLGDSPFGKINAIVLVWAGFILSCIGTATLSASVVIRHIHRSFDDLEEKIKRNKKN